MELFKSPSPQIDVWLQPQAIVLKDGSMVVTDIAQDEPFQKPKTIEPDLVKVYRNAIDRAIARLNQMPDDGEGLMEVPWARTDRPKIATETWADAPLRSFRIDELTATQPFVNRDTIIWHLEHLNDAASDNKAMPNVVVDGDMNLIYDGHHRLVALWLLGADSANCWKVEI